jgi:exoribonuclease R
MRLTEKTNLNLRYLEKPVYSTHLRLANFGFFVERENYFVEGLVKLSSFKDDAYQYYEKDQPPESKEELHLCSILQV